MSSVFFFIIALSKELNFPQIPNIRAESCWSEPGGESKEPAAVREQRAHITAGAMDRMKGKWVDGE